jgi:WW domain-containing oxidoreductase
MAPNLETNVCNEVKGTILITGANGSLGYWFVWTLLRNYPSCFAILAVRDDGAQDPNTSRLRKLIAGFKDAKVSIEKVDLASLPGVRYFADSVSARISTGALPPISALVCNAFNWSLVGQQKSLDGYDLLFQVTHLSHFLLVLKLLGSVDKKSGRVVFLGSEAHDENNVNGFNKLGAVIPENLEELLRPPADEPGEGQPRGFQRYGNAKLATVMFMHMLNRKLLQVRSFSGVTLAVEGLNISDQESYLTSPRRIHHYNTLRH